MPSFGSALEEVYSSTRPASALRYLNVLEEAGQVVAQALAEDTAAIGGEEAVAAVSGISGGMEALFALAVFLVAVCILDGIVLLLWLLRNLVGPLPIVGGALQHLLDLAIRLIGSLALPVDDAIENAVHGAAQGLVALFHALVGITHTARLDHVGTLVGHGVAPLHKAVDTVTARLAHIEAQIGEILAHQTSTAHALWSRLQVLESQISTLAHRIASVETLAHATARALHPLLSQVPQIWHWLHVFNSAIHVLNTQVKHLQRRVRTLEKDVEELQKELDAQAKLLEPALATLAVLSLLLPIVNAGETGIKCLTETAKDCGRSKLHPDGETCWIEDLEHMAKGLVRAG